MIGFYWSWKDKHKNSFSEILYNGRIINKGIPFRAFVEAPERVYLFVLFVIFHLPESIFAYVKGTDVKRNGFNHMYIDIFTYV